MKTRNNLMVWKNLRLAYEEFKVTIVRFRHLIFRLLLKVLFDTFNRICFMMSYFQVILKFGRFSVITK